MENKKRYMVYDPTDSGEPQIFDSLEEAKESAHRRIDDCCDNLSDPREADWYDGIDEIIITEIIYVTKKIEECEMVDYILVKV